MGTGLLKQVTEFFAPVPPHKLGLAVSGGGDSMALMHLAQEMCQQTRTDLHVVTVDHGLRAASAEEARQVAVLAKGLGLPHTILRWDNWDRVGNLQNEARSARYLLITEWAASKGIGTVALGHTADDQAETVLMRLARRSGVDGLAGMSKRRTQHGISWVRPLLNARRAELRSYLKSKNASWIDDPSNEDLNFDRIKARKALAVLSDVGIDAEGLSVVAENMSMASAALNWQTFSVMQQIGETRGGCIRMNARLLGVQPVEIQRRLLLRAIYWITGKPYAPRHGAMVHVLQAISEGSGATVDGCQVQVWRGRVWVFREYQAVRNVVSEIGQLWDGRWQVTLSEKTVVPAAGLELRALGPEGLKQCPNWRETGKPYASLLSSPAVWSGQTVVSAPVAGCGQSCYAEIDGGEESFFAVLLTH